MANRETFYFKEPLKEERLNGEFDNAEMAIWNAAADLGLYGIVSGGGVSGVTTAGTSELTVAPFLGVDKNGKRLALTAPLLVFLFDDYTGAPTFPSSGNFKWLTLVARYGKLGSALVVDGDSANVYTVETEGISSTGDVTVDTGASNFGMLRLVQGTQASSAGAANRPAVPSPDIIICDVLIDSTGYVVGGASGVSTGRTDRMPIARRSTPPINTSDYEAGVNFMLLEEHALSNGEGILARRYVGYAGNTPTLVTTVNAKWDGVAKVWNADAPSFRAVMEELSIDGFAMYTRNSGGSPWTDARFDPGGWDAEFSIGASVVNGKVAIDGGGGITGTGPQSAHAGIEFFAMAGYPDSGPNSDVQTGFTWPQGFTSTPSSITLTDVVTFNIGSIGVSAAPEGGVMFGAVTVNNIQVATEKKITASL